MTDEQTKAFGPGDDHPASPASAPATAAKALGPGDDDPRSPAGPPSLATPAPRPGDSVGDPEEDFEMFAPPAPGPGDPAAGPRHVGRVLKRAPVDAPVSTQPVKKTPDAAPTITSETEG